MKKKILALLAVGLMLATVFGTLSVSADNMNRQTTGTNKSGDETIGDPSYNLKIKIKPQRYIWSKAKAYNIIFTVKVSNKGPDNCESFTVEINVNRLFPIPASWPLPSEKGEIAAGDIESYAPHFLNAQWGVYTATATVSATYSDDMSVCIFFVRLF